MGGALFASSATVVPPPAPAAKGFDMSLFQKPGEWKCETCLVKNPPGGDKCVSCETPKPGGVQAGGATAASGSGSSGFFASSTVGDTLFASSATVVPSPAPAAKGFDMSLFQKPDESKCETCLVKNPPGGDKWVSCETPKPGGVQALLLRQAPGRRVFMRALPWGALFASSTTVVPSPAPAAKGFDMSLFQKPGEWKCKTCLVKNPPGGDKCVLCETPKPRGVQAGGATAASGSSGFFASSTVGGALFASSAPTIPSFTFGVQAGVVSGRGSFGEAQKNGTSTGASPAKII